MALPAETLHPPQKRVEKIPAKLKLQQGQAALRQRNTAAYARVSTELEEQQSSYESQISYYTDKIMANKEWRFAGIYADEGISGTQAKKRPQFQKLIRDCRAGKIDIILVKSISRFARNTVESLQYIRELKELGVAVIFEKENINTMEADGETYITLQSCMAQAESESISENVKWGKRRAYADGKVTYHYKKWYGYERGEDGQPQPIPAQAEVVREIFNNFLLGHSAKQIADSLNGRGIHRKDGETLWHASQILNILSSERYAGDVLLQKTYVKNCLTKEVVKNNGELPQYYITNAHAAIVDRGIYNRAQEELARRTSKRAKVDKPCTTGKSKHSAKFALTDLLVCGECGTAYRRCTWVKNGQKKVVWRCISRLEHGKKYCQNSPTIEESRLHDAITAAIREFTSGRAALLVMLQGSFDVALGADGDESVSVLRHRKKELEKAMLDLAGTLTGENEIEQYAAQFQDMRRRAAEIDEKIATAEKDDREQEAQSGQARALADALAAAPLEVREFDNDLVRQLVEVIQVVDENCIRVRFKDGRVVARGLG